jgi:DNA mismatch repair protein MutL
MGSFYPRGAFTGQQQDYPAPPGAAVPRQDLPALKVVGQVKLTYIVAEGPEGMFLVDQHAAHARVLFDQIRRRASERTAQSQPLLEPVTVELTAGQAGVFKSNAEFLASYGFDVESFGENAYLLRSVPSVLTGQDPAQSLVNVLDMVAFEGLLRQQEDVLAASIACHSAIRAGKSLTEAEMGALLEQLEASDNPHTCPHGRPTMLHFSSYQMDREFGRR